MNKITKKAIIVLTIIVIVIIIVLIFFINNQNYKSDYVRQEPPEEALEEKYDNSIRKCDITNNYFIVKNIINNYYSNCQKLMTDSNSIEVYREAINEEALKNYKEEQAEKQIKIAKDSIYNMLDDKCINEFNISSNNIQEKFGIKNQVDTIIKNMYMLEDTATISTYFVDGIIVDTKEKKVDNFYIAVNLDIKNNTFSIFSEEYCKKKGYDNLENKINVESLKEEIDDKKYNKYEYKSYISDGDIVKEYFYNYKYSMMYDLKSSYDMLNDEYKNKRFETYENYEQYVKENFDVLSQHIISKYQISEDENSKKYICLDNYNNYYIFNQKCISDYNLLLDTYTIESQEFLEKYNNADEYKKAGMDAEKFIEAVNMKDYNYIYDHLSDEFKNRNFRTKEDLQEYLENNLFVYNKINYNNYDKEADVIVFNASITDNYENKGQKNITIVVKIENGTDYKMSFSIE